MATVEIVMEGRDNTGGMFDGIGGAFSNLGNIVTGIKAGFDLLAGAFNGIVDFGSQFVESAMESESAVAKLEAVLRATGGAAGLSSKELQNMANALQEQTMFSDEAILSAESMLLTFRNIGEETFPRALQAMLDMSSMFGGLEQSSVQLGKALNDPIAGISALQRVGITFSEVQKEQIKNFMELGDVGSAQAIILKEIEQQVGGLAQAMGETSAGQLEIFKNKLDTIKELIGGPLLVIVGSLADAFTRFMDTNPVFQGIIGFLERWNELLNVGQPFWYSLGLTFLRFADVSPIFHELGDAFIDFQHALDNGIAPLEAINTLLDGLAEGGGPLAGIAQTIQTFIETGETEGWGTAIQNLFTGITSGLDFSGIIQRLLDTLQTSVTNTDWTPLGKTIADILSGAILIALRGMDIIVNQVDWKPLGEALRGALSEVWAGMFNSEAGAELDRTLTQFFKDFFRVDAIQTAWEDIGNGITEGLGKSLTIENMKTNIKTFIDDVVLYFKQLLGIASPSTVFMSIGFSIIGGLIAGFNGMITLLKIAINNVISTILGPFQPILDLLGIDIGTSGGTLGSHTPGGGTGGTIPTTGGGTVVNQYFAGANIYVGTWDEISYDCIYPNPFIASTSGQLGTGGGSAGGGSGNR